MMRSFGLVLTGLSLVACAGVDDASSPPSFQGNLPTAPESTTTGGNGDAEGNGNGDPGNVDPDPGGNADPGNGNVDPDPGGNANPEGNVNVNGNVNPDPGDSSDPGNGDPDPGGNADPSNGGPDGNVDPGNGNVDPDPGGNVDPGNGNVDPGPGNVDPPAPAVPLPFGSGPLANGLCAANTGLGSGSVTKDLGYVVLRDGRAVRVKSGVATFINYSDGTPVTDAIAISNGDYSNEGSFCLARTGGSMHCGGGTSANLVASHASGIVSLSGQSISGGVCAIMEDGSVACGGSGGLSPAATGSSEAAIQMSCARGDCCGVDAAGDIHCLGGATPTDGPNARALMVAGMDNNQCAVFDDGQSYCWGSANWGGQTADSPVQANPIAPVPIAGTMAAFAGGQFHGCWLLANGTVTCSGNGGGTTLGAGGGSAAPTQIRDESGNALSNIVAISAGRGMSCAAANDGDLYCWGAAGGQAEVAVRIDLGGGQVRMPDDCLAP